ncbi:MAG TPA: 3-hydroxyacyl-CoA dehydrogenase NAD-binding domain-containing protein [Gaiella sp.]|uniref:3-hydroxyacyl-CoA dehydrogenase NAD-binding domain-containing protein n=1 Tax=Gaiella sp. TaxID=2663207 RepID=UPI002D7E3565|nr:3-hydroxyacyl-CoA dehydrogenase NAD-binding domain-containing protein [Gaiella sp.]HET9287406.1 3-hydroxyacyl-CoA dehydrogenase NAD-binding domain-containing protein [Gaiella sp.]
MADDPVTQFHLQRLDTRVGPVALVTIDNGADWRKPSTFGPEALASLSDVLDRLAEPEWRGLVLTGKPLVFAAGADITRFPGITPELARQGGKVGHELFGRLRELPFPTLAAVNGAALGGGLEIALHCDVRTLASSVRHLAFPEVFLGLFPAWGGTQLTPRLLGAEAAVRLIVDNPLRQNRMVRAAEALELGLVDHVLEPVEFLDDSLELLLRRVEAGEGKRALDADLSDAADVVGRARSRVDDAVHGQAPAPYRALELIEGAAAWSLDEGYAAEEDALAELLPGPEAQASIYAFDVVERRIRRPPTLPDVEPRRIQRVGVVGAGLMATQLATLFLRRLEVPVVLTDVDREQTERAVESIRGELAALVAKGRLPEGKARFLGSIVDAGEGAGAYAGCDLVLEAVFEELDVKREVLAALEAVVSPECLLVTNTSALSVAAMAEGLAHPKRVVGLHFFNPVAVLPLVEVVRGPQTDDSTLATAWDVARKLGKRPVLVKDAPAFVVNRMLTRQSTVLMQGLESGNTFEETDEAALRLGIPMPPSALLAMVGPRVANHVLATLNEAYPDRFPLSPTLQALADGDLPAIEARDGRATVEEIHGHILEALADEAGHILDEGVVSSAAEIDACLILGAGYPFFRGGITKHLDQAGVSQRVLGRPLGER